MKISSSAVKALLTVGVALCFSSGASANQLHRRGRANPRELGDSPGDNPYGDQPNDGPVTPDGPGDNPYGDQPNDGPVTPDGPGDDTDQTDGDGGVSGDPHFKTWSGMKYDYHGICDLLLLSNPNFARGLGMEIHIRSKKTKNWSYISTAVVRIGSETFEVSGEKDGNTHYLNGDENETRLMGFEHLDMKRKGDVGHSTFNGYPMTLKVLNEYQRTYEIELRNAADGAGDIGTAIQFKTWKDFVRVDITNPTDALFNGSTGLMGAYPSGNFVARDGRMVIEDIQQFGQEWQVSSSDPKIFHLKNDGPQQPESMCVSPSAETMRRGLSESVISRSDAEVACRQINNNNYREDEFDLCVFDVMATGDMSIASGGVY